MQGNPVSARTRGAHGSAVRAVIAAGCLATMAGCHSRFVEATIDNRGPRPLQLVEVDYPSAGFGKDALAAHSQYHYRFKILGSGSVKLSFTDDQGKTHTSTGPELDEGQEGSLAITIDEVGHVQWTPELKTPN
jgi:hypothetical protein